MIYHNFNHHVGDDDHDDGIMIMTIMFIMMLIMI